MRKTMTKFDVLIRHKETGKEHRSAPFAFDAVHAARMATETARRKLGLSMAERIYGTFEVVAVNDASEKRP